MDSKGRLVARRLCYAKPTRSSWPLKQGRMGDLSQLKEDLSEESVCEPPRACLCCHRPPEMVELDLLSAYQGLKDTTKGERLVEDHLPTSITQEASNLHSDKDMEDKIKLLDPRVQKLIRTYLEVLGVLPPPASRDKLVQLDLKLKPEFVGHKIRRRPYPALKEQADEMERQIRECIDAGLVLEYKDGDYPQHCSPCFLVAKPGSTAKRLVVDYGELIKKTLNHSGSIPNMESTVEKIASCRYKTKMDKRSGFWQVDLTPNAQELLAFITPQGRVFKWKVMPFDVGNTSCPSYDEDLRCKNSNPVGPRWRRTWTMYASGPIPTLQWWAQWAEGKRVGQPQRPMQTLCDEYTPPACKSCKGHGRCGTAAAAITGGIPAYWEAFNGEFFAVCQENHTRL